jgi:murein DD-endopeptidase MepM/ murein hydrolase activator NlpD
MMGVPGAADNRSCRRCGSEVEPRSPHVRATAAGVFSYCSAECLQRASQPISIELPLRTRRWWRTPLHLSLVALGATQLSWPEQTAKQQPAPPVLAIAPQPPPPEPYGPPWPPSEEDWLGQIAADAWLHPLDGPTRRMPIRDSRVFGAERPGDRPGECRSGHCGVDIGESWGEPVHAVHEGVVDRVQRGPNEEHGGLYVRIAHRDGTIYSQYFHLCAIPRWIKPGVQVKAGQLIGLLGDSGVKESEPHLHFTLSVKPSKDETERYIDPESLIAIWPLRTPEGAVSVTADPGIPVASRMHKKKKTPKLAVTDEPPSAD